MQGIDINAQFTQVLDFINNTSQPLFLTGKAGTGKTTLLKYIKQNTFKQLAVVAPTGVAAINAGGTTIHSFFQFPFTPYLLSLRASGEVDYSQSHLPALKYNAERLAVFRNLELLVIDEVSMVRADLLDQVDVALRQTRRKWHLPFGGVQVLLIGDMYQLPPVVQPQEWQLLSGVYPSPFFFDSRVVKDNALVQVELEKIYRQSEATFIGLLNQVRNNQLDAQGLELLNARYRPNLAQSDYLENITLTTHNRKADEINIRNLASLPGPEFRFRCRTEGTFSEKSYPADEQLVLKEGTRVMFLRNNAEKNYYNGKIGLVTFVSRDKIRVKCEEDRGEIEVGQEMWNNVSYSVNGGSHHVEENILGTFTQYPLRLAWAITIHKSQGLTFDKLIIDAAESFSAGQVYVALSRCRSLQGLTFSSPINPRSLLSDNNVKSFSATRQGADEIGSIYQSSRNLYLKSTLHNLFDLTAALGARKELGGLLQLYRSRLNAPGIDWLEALFAGIEALSEVAAKFGNQLKGLLDAAAEVEANTIVQDRVKKAAGYFDAELQKLVDLLQNCALVTESKEASDEIAPVLQQLFEDLYTKRHLIAGCAGGFVFADYVKQKLGIKFPAMRISIYASAKNTKVSADVKYPDLYRKLLLLRDEICNDEHKPVYLVATNKTLVEIASFLPDSEEHLLNISGFGEARLMAFGERFLRVIREYMSGHDLVTGMGEKTAKKARKAKTKKEKEREGEEMDAGAAKKAGTREQTFELYKQGHSLAEIAKQRGYTLSTIEGHLVPYIASGEIELDALVERPRQQIIRDALEGFSYETGLNPVKSKLPADVSFSEIKYVLAAKLAAQGGE